MKDKHIFSNFYHKFWKAQSQFKNPLIITKVSLTILLFILVDYDS